MEKLIFYGHKNAKNNYKVKVLKKLDFYNSLDTCSSFNSETEFRAFLSKCESEGMIKIIPCKETIIYLGDYGIG